MSASRPAAPPPETLLKPLRRLLRPLVRLLIRSGITFPVLADLLRGLYVDVAAYDLLTEGSGRTDSRIHLLTGIHRKEIRKLREQRAAAAEEPVIVTVGSQVIARWLMAPWTGADGAPLPLRRVGGSAASPTDLSFERLVESVTTDIRPRAVLDDLLDNGIVTLQPGDMVRLDVAGFVPRPGRDEQLFYFARNLHDHIAAASDNIVAPGPAPFLDRAVHYDRLTEAAAGRVEVAGRAAAQQLLIEINRIAAMEADAASPEGEASPARHRINLGVYMYLEREPDAEGG